MQRPFKFTKLKLITGYILILLLGAIAIVFIYKQTIALTQKGNDEIVMQQKLFIISNTLDYLKQYAGTQYTGETNYINDQAVRDNNIVTANGNAPLEFCREILYQLNAATPEIIEETYSFYKNEL